MESAFNSIIEFLQCRTPPEWIEKARQNIPLLLLDHAHAEKKAALTAISFISKYPEQLSLVENLSRLAREELSHFDKVLRYLKKQRIPFQNLSPSRYARTLHKLISSIEPQRLRDSVLIAAIIEARSCERFLSLSTILEGELKTFYELLAQAETRHYKIYLAFAKKMDVDDFEGRLSELLAVEKELILNHDATFRFHGGISLSH